MCSCNLIMTSTLSDASGWPPAVLSTTYTAHFIKLHKTILTHISPQSHCAFWSNREVASEKCSSRAPGGLKVSACTGVWFLKHADLAWMPGNGRQNCQLVTDLH